MQKIILIVFSILLSATACQSNEKERLEQQKLQEKQAQVFKNIQQQWVFPSEPANATASKLIAEWDAWRNFMRALEQKPQNSIEATLKKAAELGNLATIMQNNVPLAYNTAAVRARLSMLVSKLNQLELQLQRNPLPEELTKATIRDINKEIQSFQSQLEEIDRRANIPAEWGESDLVRMRDTTRALPANAPINFDE